MLETKDPVSKGWKNKTVLSETKATVGQVR